MMPKMAPKSTALNVNSGRFALSGTYGRNSPNGAVEFHAGLTAAAFVTLATHYLRPDVSRPEGTTYGYNLRHGRTSAGHPVCRPRASPPRGSDRRHRDIAWHRHRRQHRDLQRRQRPAAEAAAVSGARPPRGAVAAFARHQHSAGLAVSGAVHRRAHREPVVRRDVDLARPLGDTDRRHRGAARGSARNVVEPVPAAWR